MKLIVNLFAICTVCCLYCCQNNTNNDRVIDYRDLEEVESIKFGDRNYFDTCFLVKLETDTMALLANITQLEIFGNDCYIWDKTADQLSVFDLQGNYQRTIGRKGRAPNEYAALSGFYINPHDSTIHLFDPLMMVIKKYDLKGKYIKDTKHTNQDLCFVVKATMLDSCRIFCYHSSNWRNNHVFSVVNVRNYDQPEEVVKYPYKSSQYISYTLSNQPYMIRDGKFVYTKLFSNILYTGMSKREKSYLKIEGKKKIDDKLLAKKLEEEDGNYLKVRNQLVQEDIYDVGFLNFFENKRFMLFDFVVDKSLVKALLWDKKKNKGVKINNYSTFTPDLQMFKLASENSLVCVWDRSALVAFREELMAGMMDDYPESVKQVVMNFKEEEDNPILIIFTFKEGMS